MKSHNFPTVTCCFESISLMMICLLSANLLPLAYNIYIHVYIYIYLFFVLLRFIIYIYVYIYICVYICIYIYSERERDSCIYWSYSFEFFWSSLDWSCSVGFPHQKDAIRRISFFKTTWMSWTHNTSKASWDFELGIKFKSCLLNRVSGATDRTMPPNRNRRDDQTSAAQAQHRKNNTAF